MRDIFPAMERFDADFEHGYDCDRCRYDCDRCRDTGQDGDHPCWKCDAHDLKKSDQTST